MTKSINHSVGALQLFAQSHHLTLLLVRSDQAPQPAMIAASDWSVMYNGSTAEIESLTEIGDKALNQLN